jgi:hypothetical protein
MIPFIVRGTVIVTGYQLDPYEVEDQRIVMATNADEARDKYCAYWNSKTEEYSIYYDVDCAVMDTIL